MNDDLYPPTIFDPGRAMAEPNLSAAEAGDPFEIAKRGIMLREQSAFDEAEALFQFLIDRFGYLAYGWQELGVMRRRQRREEDALALFRIAADVQPADPLPRKHLAFQLARLGRPEEAQAALDPDPTTRPPRPGASPTYRAFVDFVAAHPEQATNEQLREISGEDRYLRPSQVAAPVRAAIEEGRPLSLIRLGDGEGAWLFLDEADEARYAPLYEANRREMLKVWFGSDALYGQPGFMDLARRFRRALERTDLIGIPKPTRIFHEYGLASVRGIPSIANILRLLAPLDRARAETGWTGRFCDNDVHLDLHLDGTLRDLLTSGYDVGVISCHADLGYRLAGAYGARVVRQIIVPEEKSFSQVSGVSGLSEAHYPLIFYRTLDRLAREATAARLWLIGAGFLGKLYCDAIRQQGAVALDIGSVADGWCGRITRPTLQHIGIGRFALTGAAP